jgi:hypothetical protein
MQKYIGDFDTNCSYIIMQNKCWWHWVFKKW